MWQLKWLLVYLFISTVRKQAQMQKISAQLEGF